MMGKTYVIDYDIKLIHWHCVGTNEDGPMYDGEPYILEDYEFEVSEEQVKEKLSTYEDIDWSKSIEELFEEYYFELKDDFEKAAQAEAEDYQERGFL